MAKSPSLDLLKLSLLFTPSSVMATKESGRPLKFDSRLVVAVLTPGRNVTALMAFRVGSGILLISSTLSVDEIVAVLVLTISLPPATVTVSAKAPTSSALP
jgi:hypothetical protein